LDGKMFAYMLKRGNIKSKSPAISLGQYIALVF
jgi:hypothetical protein